ncbi:MAG TPA: peptide-binding protein, partial [Campylobacterales bacterium]|nr:peptide-binding protein [Campylobacterales bacterium]
MMFKGKDFGYKEIGIMIIIAYLFSFAVRLIWVFQFKDVSSFYWNDQLMINTNDGYFFASAVDYLLNGVHADNPRVQIAIDSYPAFVYTSYFLTKYTPMSLETTILYMPSIISSLVVIPIILTGKLLKLPWVGFFSALLGSIAWSYYNRTMTGYYDTDMFSVFLQFTILYLFLLTLYHKDSINILYLSIGLLIYPYYYPQGLSLIYAIFILWVAYQLIFQREEKNSYLFIAIAGIALWNVPILVKILIIGAIFIALNKIEDKLDNKKLLYLSIVSLFMFFIFGDVFQIIWFKIVDYTNKGVKEQGLHFYQVIQTVREAGSISWETVANRIIGGVIPLVISVIGYILLVIRHKQFLIALPLIGVGIFAHWAGLRFTVYAVPVA